jgi:hypothetical protein
MPRPILPADARAISHELIDRCEKGKDRSYRVLILSTVCGVLHQWGSCDIASNVWRAIRVQYRYSPHTCVDPIGRHFGSSHYGENSYDKMSRGFLQISVYSQNIAMSKEKIRIVAIVGAGISGVVAASHLLRYGLQVTVFERSNGRGGVW